MFSLPAYAKINLSFEVLRLRADGYHEVRTVLAVVDIADELEFAEADALTLSVEPDGAAPADEGVATEGDDRLIEELEIGVRAYNCLKRAGVQTIGDLVQKSQSELNAIPNFGGRSTEEGVESLSAIGLALREE